MENVDFTKGELQSKILKMAIPMSIGMFFNTMFNVVDTYFAGQLGTYSLAGMSLSFAIFFFLLAISSGISTGLGALISIAIGKKNENAVKMLTANGFYISVVTAVLVTIVGSLSSPYLLRLLGASSMAVKEGYSYLLCIFSGSIFFSLNAMLNATLSSRGITKPFRNFLIIGFLLNLVLDPLFIFGFFGIPKLGTFGVALATVIVQAIGTIYLWRVNAKNKIFNREMLSQNKPSIETMYEILSQGIPAALNIMTIALGIFVIQFFIYRYGNDSSIAGYGAAMRIEQIVLLPAIGLNVAVMTAVGHNYGAKDVLRVRKAYFETLKIGIIIMIVGMALVYVFSPSLIAFFNDDPKVISDGTQYLRIEFLALIAYVLLNVSLSTLQGIKKPNYAIWIGLYRQLFMPILLFLVLAEWMNFGLIGIWWSIVLTTWSGAIIISVVLNRELKKLEAAL